ncbi:MAG: SDR family NAD(P)-dependent oxidoreductase [Treponema sp.]|jgi:NAD(P)-dependent dehydrogenase (short-subunit alcohol dehydrogenase family)|nr:SDR family NAD(P)-dependent oxidoreductase [Treponema sp.]
MTERFVHGRVALVTGASSGIGAAAARLFAERGYTVYGASRRGTVPGAADPVAADPLPAGPIAADPVTAVGKTPETAGRGLSGVLRPLVMDLSDNASVAAGIGEILRREGALDILVHAAGDGLAGPAETCAAEDAVRQMEVNYFGALRLLGAALPAMRERRRGLVILVGSVGGIFSIPFQTLYSSSKAALAMLGEGLRLELRPFNIRCSLVLPGDVRTGFTAARRSISCPEVYRRAMKGAVAVMERDERRGMPPEAVARAIADLARKKHPPAHRVLGGTYRLFVFLNRLLPYCIVEKLLAMTYLRDEESTTPP